MKKFFAILLTVCMMATLVVMPVSAADGLSYDYWLDLSKATILSHDITSDAHADASATPTKITEYPISNVFDGDPSTAGVFNLLGRSKYWAGGSTGHEVSDVFLAGGVMLDLGQEYEIKGFATAAASSSAVSAVSTAYPDRMNSISTTAQGMIYLCKNSTYNSATDFRWNKYNNWGSGTNEIPAGEKYRYIYITALGSNQTGLALGEFYLKVAGPASGVRYSMFRYPTGTGDYPYYEYPMSNLFDGKTDTHASIALRRNNSTAQGLWVIDLGETKVLEGIKFVVPSNWATLYANAGCTSTLNTPLAKICVSETEPAITSFDDALTASNLTCISGERSDGETMWMDSTKNKEFDSPMNVRYITIKQSNATYPVIISEIILDEYVAPKPEFEASFASEVAFGDVDGVDTLRFYFTPTYANGEVTDFGAYIVPFALFDDAETEAVTALGGKTIESGKTFAADLVGIPAAAYNSTIVGVPFVVVNGGYVYGDAASTTVNSLK